MSETTLADAAKAIVAGDADKAADLAKRGLDEGIEPLKLLDQGFVPGINGLVNFLAKASFLFRC